MSTIYPNLTHYSEHFPRTELNCNCGCKPSATVQANLLKLANYLEALRSHAGRPLSVNCAHRCAKENRRVGGTAGSFHLTGSAADINCQKKDAAGNLDSRASRAEVERLASCAAKVPAFKASGIGKYFEAKGLFLHVDFGPRYWRGVDGK